MDGGSEVKGWNRGGELGGEKERDKGGEGKSMKKREEGRRE